MTKDVQIIRLCQLLGEGKLLFTALKVGMDAKTARKYRHAPRLPSESFTPGTWRSEFRIVQGTPCLSPTRGRASRGLVRFAVFGTSPV
jgi:hypothetical protein